MKIFLEPRRCSDYTVPVSRRIVINLYSISFLLCLILKCIKIPHRKCLADLFYLQNNQNACSFIHFIVNHVSIYNKNGMFSFTTKFYFRIQPLAQSDKLKPREKSEVKKECLGLIGQSPGGNPQGYKKGLDLIQQNTGTRRLPVFCQRSGPNQQNKEIH